MAKDLHFASKHCTTSNYWFLTTMEFIVCARVCFGGICMHIPHITSVDAMKFVMWLILVVRKLYSESIHLRRRDEFCNFTLAKKTSRFALIRLDLSAGM